MSKEETTNTPEVKEESESTENQTVATDETTDEESVASLHEEESEESKPVPNTVPKSRLDKEIKKRKELEKQLADATKAADEDDDVDDPEDDSEVKKLAKDLEEIKQRERRVRAEQVFEQHFTKALENNSDYKDVVNKEVIKQMAFNPANKDKTYSQLIQEAYGNAIPGRKTVESTTPRGGAKDVKVDVDLARKDPEYRREVLSDPDMRKQYNSGIEKRIGL